MSKRNCIVIVGAGGLGCALASRLSQRGHGVVVVDRSDEALEALPAEFRGSRVRGDASERETLRRARLSEASRVLVVTDRDDLNLLVALVARHEFAVPRVSVRVSDATLHSLYDGLEVDTVNPNALAAGVVADEIEP